MNTAYFGDGPSRRGSPFRILLAALAMMVVAPLTAVAQEPPAAPPAANVDTSIPGVTPPAAEVAPAATPEAAPAPAAAADATAEDAVGAKKNPFGIEHLWTSGDIVARSTLVIMVVMFLGTVYIAATKAVDQTILAGQARKLGRFWEANSLDEGLDALGHKSAFRSVAEGAIAQANSSQSGLGARISRSDRTTHQVGIELERINSRLQAGMAFLATVGSICPFVGLFGTVWGIVHALTKIGATGDASIEAVAGPVGEALYMTAIGLGVAVPAVVFYNLLGRRNKLIYDQARHFAFDVEKLMSSSTK